MNALFRFAAVLLFLCLPARAQFASFADQAFLAEATTVSSVPLNLDPFVIAWTNRIQINGLSTLISARTLTNVNQFLLDVVAAGITNKILADTLIPPDDIIAVSTPFFHVYGSDPWVLNNVSGPNLGNGDLTVNGVHSTRAAFLTTGINPSTTSMTAGSAGMAVYLPTVNQANNTVAGCSDFGFSQSFAFFNAHSSGSIFWECFGATGGATYVQIAGAGLDGWLSGQRTSTSRNDLYRAYSGLSHTSIGNSTVTSSATPPNVILDFLWFTGGTGPDTAPDVICSYYAVTLGMTSTEDAAYFAAVDKMRRGFGGGFK